MGLFNTTTPPSMKAACDAWGFSPATHAHGFLFVSGQTGVNLEDMSVPESLDAQIDNMFASLKLVLAESGADLADIVSMTSYHVGDMHEQLPVFIAAKEKAFGQPKCAWTAVGMRELALPGLMIEASAIALVNR